MWTWLKKYYRKLMLKFYLVGKVEAEQYAEHMLMQKANVGANSRFYPGADIYNLSNDINRISIGENCHISGLIMVYEAKGKITLGDHCSLSPYSRLISSESIHIGNRVLIAHNVNIIDNISHPLDAQLRHQDFKNSYDGKHVLYDIKPKPITIEDDVWIGFGSTILRGVSIGRGAIIGSDTVVTKDIEPWTINVGNPIRCIRKIESNEYLKNDNK